jgi:hypothetical protein
MQSDASPQYEYRLAAFKHLRTIRDLLYDHRTQHLEEDDFHDYQIRQGEDMSFDPDASIDFDQRFIQPLSADSMETQCQNPALELPELPEPTLPR